jgi:hypothetical protein
MTSALARRRITYEKIPGYSYNYRKSFRLGEFDMVFLKALATRWRCSESEAIRRSIVYTFTKLFAGAGEIDENAIMRALNLAYDVLRKTSKQNNTKVAED